MPVSDTKTGLTLGDVANQVGQNKIGINFTWTLICGFLVMFMQAGFAMVESGLCRAKNANHTMMMNFFVYGVRAVCVLAHRLRHPDGRRGGNRQPGRPAAAGQRTHALALWQNVGHLRAERLFPLRSTYDVGVMVIFLFQMVFMDTALTIVTGAGAERWKFLAFSVSSVLMGALTYPLFANWAWGGGWLAQLGTNFGLGQGYADFAGSGVVHSVGGVTALAVALIIGPRIGKFNRDGSANAIIGHDIVGRADRLLHPGLRLVRIQSRQHAGRIRHRQPAHRFRRGEHHAGRHDRRLRRTALHVVAKGSRMLP